MKFKIRRCSQPYRSDDPSFPGAFKEGDEWFVYITELDQLISQLGKNKKLNRKDWQWEHQGIVLEPPNQWEEHYQLIIYDDYLE